MELADDFNVCYALIVFRNMFPENLIQACFQQIQTIYVASKTVRRSIVPASNATEADNDTDLNDVLTTVAMTTADKFMNLSNGSLITEQTTSPVATVVMKRSLKYVDGINVLGEFNVSTSMAMAAVDAHSVFRL